MIIVKSLQELMTQVPVPSLMIIFGLNYLISLTTRHEQLIIITRFAKSGVKNLFTSPSHHVFVRLCLCNSGSTLKREFAPFPYIVFKFPKVFFYKVEVNMNKFIILGEIYCFKLPKCLTWEQHIIIRDKDIRTKISMIWNFPCGDRNKIKKLLLWPYWHKGLWSYVLEMVCFIVHSVFLDISL